MRPISERLTPEEQSGVAAAKGVFALMSMDHDDQKGRLSSHDLEFYLDWDKPSPADAAWIRAHVSLWGTRTEDLERAGFSREFLAKELVLPDFAEVLPLASIKTSAGTLICVTKRQTFVILERPDAGVFF